MCLRNHIQLLYPTSCTGNFVSLQYFMELQFFSPKFDINVISTCTAMSPIPHDMIQWNVEGRLYLYSNI